MGSLRISAREKEWPSEVISNKGRKNFWKYQQERKNREKTIEEERGEEGFQVNLNKLNFNSAIPPRRVELHPYITKITSLGSIHIVRWKTKKATHKLLWSFKVQ